MSGVSATSFSDASSFSFSLGAAFALLAMHFSWTPVPADTTPPYPMRGDSKRAATGASPSRSSDSALLEVSARVIKPRLTLRMRGRKLPREISLSLAPLLFPNHKERTGRPDDAPKPSIRASVPSLAASWAFTSCNQE